MTKIYTLEHPITKEVRYVGKTSKRLKDRYWNHISCFYNNSYKDNWIKSLLNQGLRPVIKELDICEDDGNALETYWIAQFRAWGFKLTNLTDGGEGTVGIKRSEEYTKRMSEIHKGKVLSEETREKIRLANIGKTLSDEHKAKIGLSSIGRGLKAVKQYDKITGELIREYDSAELASKSTGIIRSAITNCCNGFSKSSGGYLWRY